MGPSEKKILNYLGGFGEYGKCCFSKYLLLGNASK
jgi:hypothetical protein